MSRWWADLITFLWFQLFLSESSLATSLTTNNLVGSQEVYRNYTLVSHGVKSSYYSPCLLLPYTLMEKATILLGKVSTHLFSGVWIVTKFFKEQREEGNSLFQESRDTVPFIIHEALQSTLVHCSGSLGVCISKTSNSGSRLLWWILY